MVPQFEPIQKNVKGNQMNNQITEIKISDIIIGDRHRKDMGDLQSLADSIKEVGLFHAIGLTQKKELIFGGRRLRACQEFLGWETIPARIIDIPSIVLGEYHEGIRKDYTPSELVAIVESLRAYKHGGDRKSDQYRNSDVDLTVPEAIQNVGFKKDTYCRAKKVVDQGIPELVEAMDSGKFSIYAASELANADPEDQQACLNHGNEEKWTARALQKRLRKVKRARERKEALEKNVALPTTDDQLRFFNCSFQKLEAVADLHKEPSQLWVLDIPYNKDFLPQISDLAEMAARLLDDGGLFVMYSGQYWLPEVIRRLGEHLTYRWTIASVWDGDANIVNPLDMTSQWKPILIYSKGDWQHRGRWPDVSKVRSKEKKLHDWQQPLEEVERLVRYFSTPGDLVVDPCAGSFTTAVACHRLGRRFVGCDVDKAAVVVGQERLAEERNKQKELLADLMAWIEDAEEMKKRYKNAQQEDVREMWLTESGLDISILDLYIRLLPESHRTIWKSLGTAG
jgi:site-specific DNA-methyltransferase (adenine-specific)